jgi:hypothetical protein
MELAKLKAFRQAVYNRLGAARDATFELTDAVLLTRNAYSLDPTFGDSTYGASLLTTGIALPSSACIGHCLS